MNPELERRALDLFASSLELPPEERESFLRASAAGSEELLELLLQMHGAPLEQIERSMRGMTVLAALRLEGRQLGDFRLGREIGGGAVGRVFEAVQLSLQRRVAVKVLRLAHCENQEMVERFRQEPLFQSNLQHPHIVKVLHTGLADGWHYFAMDFIEGPSLAKLIEDGGTGPEGFDAPLLLDLDSPRACAALVEKVARALHFAHTNGLVHRDVKPHNILIDRSGEPYVSDFGLARSIDRAALTASLGDGLRGTLAYMSPEQATEFHAVDARADVYSLGAVLYQMLTRCLPFEAESGVQLLSKILSPSRHVRPPHLVRPGVDETLSRISTIALEKRPERRFESALEMAEHLRAFCEGTRHDTRPSRWFVQVGERRFDRRTALAGMAVGLPVVGLTALGVRAWRAPARKASLRVVLPRGTAGVRVQLIPFLPPDHRLGAVVSEARYTDGERITGIEAGPYRIVVRDDSGASAELHRTFTANEELTVRAELTRPDPADGSMARVSGGRQRIALPELGELDLECSDFWIDRSPVTNAEYREFLQATGLPLDDQWSPAWRDLWNGTGPLARPEHWDELPVVGVSWSRAREFAEWKGKRLPTIVEWWLALGLGAGPRVTPEKWRELEQRFAFARPRTKATPDGRHTTLAAYLEYARPAREAEDRAFGPHRLWHPFGNVAQWLEPGPFMRNDAGGWVTTGMRFQAEGAWHFSPLSAEAPEGLIGLGIEANGAGDRGFRCARTATI
jgi:hypothetical protein